MPGYDKTGPEGKGPGTGRGMGGCSDEDIKRLKDMGVVGKNEKSNLRNSDKEQGRNNSSGRGRGPR